MLRVYLPQLVRAVDPAFSGGVRGVASATGPFTFVSTPIFYVNAKPHIGHLYTALLTDAAARWSRIEGIPTLFSTGTDEHGLKVQEAAENAGVSPLEYCDTISRSFKDVFDQFDISFDDYIRTTEVRHQSAVRLLWQTLYDGGHIYLGKHEGWYCQSDEAFLTDSQVEPTLCPETGVEKMVSKESGHPAVWLSETNYKFRLSAFEQPLLDWLGGEGDGPRAESVVYPPSRLNEGTEFVSSGLRDLSISRTKSHVQWALPVPPSVEEDGNEQEHSIYVWLDALTNYLTVTGYGETWFSGDDLHGEDGHFWPATHVVGKDILRFHAVYFPAFLMAANLPLPSRIIAHGHWTVDRVKMSKSLGNVVSPSDLLRTYGIDPVRFFLLRDGRLGSDGDFNHANLEMRRDAELADTMGNLITRATGKKMLPEAVLPRCVEESRLREEDLHLRSLVSRLKREVPSLYEDMEFGRAVIEIMDVLRETNRYFAAAEPWKLRKEERNGDDEAGERADTVVYHTLESLRACGIYLQPIIPASAAKVLDFLNVDKAERNSHACDIGRTAGVPLGFGGQGIVKPFILFSKEQ